MTVRRGLGCLTGVVAIAAVVMSVFLPRQKSEKPVAALAGFHPPRYAPFTAKSPMRIPFRDALTMIHSQWQPNHGDFEAEVRFERLVGDTVAFVNTAFDSAGTSFDKTYAFVASAFSTATVLTDDMCYKDPCQYRYRELASGHELLPEGQLLWHFPPPVFGEVRRAGRATLTLHSFHHSTPATLAAEAPMRVAFPVIVNGQPVVVAAIHLRAMPLGKYAGDTVDLFVLDDPRNPLLLEKWRWNRNEPYLTGLRVTQINFPAEARAIEMELITSRRAVVYGIYFAFASAEILPASEPVLREIASTLTRNRDWRLRIEGHTDSIGGAESNLRLSQRRAAAVKAALVERYGIDSGRLRVAGFGARAPVDSNSTLMGRARNRRVELIRE